MLADLAPTPLAMAVQVSCSLVTTVLSGVVIASQEFRLQSLVYFSGLVLVFTPIVLIVADDPEIEMSIAWLLWANAAYQCWLCAGQVIPPAPSSRTAAARGGSAAVSGLITPGACNAWQVFIAAVYVPRKLRRLRQARGEGGNAAADGLEASLLGGRAQGSE